MNVVGDDGCVLCDINGEFLRVPETQLVKSEGTSEGLIQGKPATFRFVEYRKDGVLVHRSATGAPSQG